MLRIIYTLLNYLSQPVLLLMMWQKTARHTKQTSRLWERYGIYRQLTAPRPQGIVIHAASVGEVIAATPLINAIQTLYPTLPITVTTFTQTASERVQAIFANTVSHIYLPFDLPFAVNRFIKFTQPRLFIVIETELWPNLITQAYRQQIPFIIANGRLSARSLKHYQWFKPALQKILNQISMIIAQDQISAERYAQLGFNLQQLTTAGNLKFDLEISEQLRQTIQKTKQTLTLANRPVWIAGSTHEGEDEIILATHQQLLTEWPDLLLILAPRHPNRFKNVENLLIKSELCYVKRSQQCPLTDHTQVLLADTLGEMMILYGLANIAFVGGSLIKHGGHNPLEPIAFGLPIISGIHTFNFLEIFNKLKAIHGVIEVTNDPTDLAQAVNLLLKDPKKYTAIAQSGLSVLKANQGSLQRHLQLLAPYLEK
ncbi:lipid IV(A) 3-deoxy-D-manno-octulosonic acid transferase [[Haemophilus] ducreyi]|uniref:lipid IV(A) 3-deoxy-D-manno-octulosonic acid transferase n=1 Tax=Haemophilus ducreyi TaxID=730 RepID=UPI000654CCD6|nr:lipid IV(A) 3-deoxy-D-manno-octulosonic acid transferase [[Haemophilus] ducreyi]AKO46086.1 3-deoxy-D-manno-octulosonic acid transferase [[Haemophilus] ducreyi]AKO47427.1 3-deoxy-D-manno-octulosonic acid transferase [[Haemophilus] ducreyi]AKO48810.1 3-deoxy-D-manno-octulosonic acid transferase [[Haemophilus] ducreyi]AKO50176.1 3-deoxy-D-manno-octulosonic acid transferase [[Haemophilus] ducreyi]ANF62624.1 3-deoxy-D-manno-octulosonic acid transferase [[Haemophilus] ducreyi]